MNFFSPKNEKINENKNYLFKFKNRRVGPNYFDNNLTN